MTSRRRFFVRCIMLPSAVIWICIGAWWWWPLMFGAVWFLIWWDMWTVRDWPPPDMPRARTRRRR